MAYDEDLASRIRVALADEDGIEERKMFGGLVFLHRGNMCCGVHETNLMLRPGPDRTAAALGRPHARPMDFTGKVSRNMLIVDGAGVVDEKSLKEWLEEALAFTRTLPAK